ncbi:hypothetical protein [Marinobacterium arenosum]|uniref:hypothetical protein n=1 Tax=Marinobacterium arenosum TaxID=2862496 RepID=UPI001C9865F1|nr:hypothetical protein [Marinobacterium arenosum]MBY4678647.1 hypothetical protein [Marinobacterium arenosum]
MAAVACDIRVSHAAFIRTLDRALKKFEGAYFADFMTESQYFATPSRQSPPGGHSNAAFSSPNNG